MPLSNPYLAYCLFAILLNAVFLIIGHAYGFNWPVVNLDYALLFLFAHYRHAVNTALLFGLLGLVIFVDVFLLVLQIYPFIQLNDIFYLSSFLFNGPVLYQVLVIAVVFYILIVALVAKDFLLKKPAISPKSYLGVWAAALITWTLSWLGLLPNAIAHQSAFFVKNYHANMSQINNLGVIGELDMPYASKPLWEAVQQNNLQSDKILFIINESWGETATPAQQQAILAPIYEHQDRLAFIHQGHMPAVGATVTGEVRELCQKRLLVVDTQVVPAHEFQNCLPNLLKKLGGGNNFTTHSVYSGHEGLYSPEYWYPLAGLDNRYFYPDLPQAGQCQNFDARCDVKLIPTIKKLLLASDKSFVYWLTLNSHAPYDDHLFYHGLDCSSLGLKDNWDACGSYKLQYQFFVALSQLVSDPELSGTEVYVIGDHPPPISNIKEGLQAFKGTQVAWLHFKIQ